MKNQTFTDVTAFIAYGQCFSLNDALKFVKEAEGRELTEEEKATVSRLYDHYRHFGF